MHFRKSISYIKDVFKREMIEKHTEPYLSDKRHVQNFGELYRDKSFYILRCSSSSWGIYTIALDFLHQLEVIDEEKCIPIVDLTSSKLCCIRDFEEDNNNKWNYYFKPILEDYSLDDVYKSKNVQLGWSNSSMFKIRKYRKRQVKFNSTNDFSADNINRFSALFNRFFVLKDDMQSMVDGYVLTHFKERKILGVAIRESYRYHFEMNHKMIVEHPRHISPSSLVHLIENKMNEWGCTHVYVTSDDEEAIGVFESYFGDRCLQYERTRNRFFVNGKPNRNYGVDTKNCSILTARRRTLDYLIEVEILSHCDSLYGQISSGVWAACMRNGNSFEHMELIDNGCY